MKIVHLMSTFSPLEPACQAASSFHRALQHDGWESMLVSKIFRFGRAEASVSSIGELSDLTAEDLIIAYYSRDLCMLEKELSTLPCRKKIYYLPAGEEAELALYSESAAEKCRKAHAMLRQMSSSSNIECILVESKQAEGKIRQLGIELSVQRTGPIWLDQLITEPADTGVLTLFGQYNLSFWLAPVTLSPENRAEDILRIFHDYHHHFNSQSHLILAGMEEGLENYQQRLMDYGEELHLTHTVSFFNPVSLSQLESLFRASDVCIATANYPVPWAVAQAAIQHDVIVCGYERSLTGTIGIQWKDQSPFEMAKSIHYASIDRNARKMQAENQRAEISTLPAVKWADLL